MKLNYAAKDSTGSISVLLVDDSPDDAELTSRALRIVGVDPEKIVHVEDAASAVEACKRGRFDVLLLDLGLQSTWGLDTLHAVRRSIKQTPIVVFSGLEDESTAQAALENGAQDYLIKGNVEVGHLGRALRYAIHRQQLIGELEEAKELLESKNKRLATLCNTAEQFVDNVSHELRTPLTVVQEFASLMREGVGGPLTEKQGGFLDTILNRVDDLSRMVDDILDTSKFEAGLLSIDRTATAVGPIANHVWPSLQRRASVKNIDLRADFPEDLPAIYCDPEKIGRVITNLAINAIKFTPQEGHVTIWARICEDPTWVEIGVKDSGPGICEADRKRIFERFHQLEHGIHSSCKGFGLGLAIARDLVTLNFGHLELDSEVGQGSTFRFFVPVADPVNIIDKYLAFLKEHDEATCVTLFEVEYGTVRARDSHELTNLLDSFISGEGRTQDLTYLVSPTRWVIASTCPPNELPRMRERMIEAWAAYRRNCPRGNLPEISVTLRETYDCTLQRAALEDAWLELTTSNEHCHDRCSSVLVVDDDLGIQQALKLRLEYAGYKVLVADNGDAAVREAIASHPDAILMDVLMPQKDGLTALDELQSNVETRSMPVIILSASIRDQQQSLERGARFFLQKPFDMNGVLEAIQTSLNTAT